MQPRLRHGTVNFNDQLVIFGGASGNLPTSGTYNDVWMFDFIRNFHRMTTSNEIPSPRANFGFVRAGERILTAGGRTLNFDPFLTNQNQFEVHMLNPKMGSWQRVITSGSEPQHSNGVRCVMLTPNELIVVSGLLPTIHNWVQESVPNGNYEHLRTSMQVSVLKFNDSKLERGTWTRLADWSNNKRGLPMPRFDFHLVNLGNDNVLMLGGIATNQVLQDAWVMRVTRQPNYNLQWIQVTVENPLIPSLPLHIFPSCLVGGNLLAFTGVRTFMKKPGIEKPKEEPKKPPQESQSTPSTSSSSQIERRTPPIFINLERPLNTIGAMAAFSVSPQPVMPPQKVLKIQTPEPSPEPPRRLQDYPMRVFCLDLSRIVKASDETLRSNPTLRWLTMKNGGLFENAPELRAHGTFSLFENGIALIGGVRRNQVDDDVLFTQATNDVYILDYVHADM